MKPEQPTSTYRVQLHAGFGFRDAAATIPYLATLGASHLYCSPYLQAAPGSTHGYDVVDPHRLNEELGGEEGYAELLCSLHTHGVGQVLDIVPNHMAVSSRSNGWWWDVLEDGPSSRYAGYFDIDWAGPDEKGVASVLVPVLADHYGREVDEGNIRVERDGDAFVVRYHDHELPLSPRTYDAILRPAAEREGSAELDDLARRFGLLPHARTESRAAMNRRRRSKEALRRRLAEVWTETPALARATDAEVAALNADPDRLDALLRRQNYRLAFWRTASDELDYRRFFNIETLVGVRVEDEEVFADTHSLVFRLVDGGEVGGLRIDHVDGLREPRAYLERLRARSDGVYTVVEKILEADEALPDDWPVEGTSGYDFLTRVGNLHVASDNEAALTDCYSGFTGEESCYGEVIYQSKRQVVTQELASEVDRLTRVLVEVSDRYRRHRDRTRRELRDSLVDLLVALPVYRTYVEPGRPASGGDRRRVHDAVVAATGRRPEVDPELFEFLAQLVLREHPGSAETEFAMRFAQVSAPVMAKGVEDTAFYRYNRLISLNEVGGSPDVFGRAVADFHADTARTAERWPQTMLTLTTHDTKRSADARARIHLLSELPGAWESAVGRFNELNECHRRDGWPDRNTEYLLYQTLVGSWPIDPTRLEAFMTKATREAKVHTSWVDPVVEYDDAVTGFTRRVREAPRFVAELEGFLASHSIVERGRVTSLTQTTLLLTCPGVPDLYQGSELWDLSLVDPDNRRPVDYHLREEVLARVSSAPPDIALRDDGTGVWKLWLISRLLADRRAHPARYWSGLYEPLDVDGPGADHAVAFRREHLAVVVPRLLVNGADTWENTMVAIPPGRWSDVLTGEALDGGLVRLSTLLTGCPVAVLARESP